MYRAVCLTLTLLLGGAPLLSAGGQKAGGEKIKVLLIGKDRDHAFGTHEYMTDCSILATCLRQTPGIEPIVSNGWPKDPEMLKGVKAIVLFTANGGDVLLGSKQRRQAEELLDSGAGLVAIHWSTGAAKGEVGERWLKTLGGWFNPDFSRYLVRKTTLQQADPKHPICRGWKEYPLRDEYYIKLRFDEKAKPVLTAEIDKEVYTVGWVYERPRGGRSFGFVCGHFHDNFGEKAFRQAIVNGILWTAGIEVPADGAPVAITAKDLELPPDPRKKK
ncbi:MAG: ThuA domain-containing protein [Gemmataceae bacterium]|nr:ThuA domain-containing protein [Gemmataceae bacterium]